MGVVGKQAQFSTWTGSPEVQAILRNSGSRSIAFPAIWRLTCCIIRVTDRRHEQCYAVPAEIK